MAENKNATSIEILTDNCLLAVFRHLPIADKIKIERVNKHWNNLSKSLWNNVKKLDLHPPSWGLRPRGSLIDDSRLISFWQLMKILKKCGNFLEDIDLTGIDQKATTNPLIMIAYFCPNIKIFNAEIVYIESITGLVENFKNIVELTLSDCDKGNEHTYLNDNKLSSLFINNKTIRKLKLENFQMVRGSCLLNLPLLERLELNRVLYICEKELAKALKLMKNLKTFKIVLLGAAMSGVLDALKICSNLEELDLEGYETLYILDKDPKLEAIFKNNKNLKILSLGRFGIIGECLIHLNNNLKELTLHYVQNFEINYLHECLVNCLNLNKFEFIHHEIKVYDYNQLIDIIPLLVGLKQLRISIDNMIDRELAVKNLISISSLTNLEELTLKNATITNKCSILFEKNFKNLKTLFLDNCNITDIAFYLITSLTKLENLYLTNMNKLTNDGFNKMANLKKIRFSDCPKIKTDCLNQILTESEKLEYLFIKNCSGIDKKSLLLCANEATRKRKNNVILYVNKNILENLNTNNLKSVKKSPFLEYTDIDVVRHYIRTVSPYNYFGGN